MDQIIITAAGTGTWLRERFTPSGLKRKLYEAWVPEYAEKMDLLREIDDRIYEWTQDLENLVKASNKAFAAGRMVDIAIHLATLNSKLKGINEIGKEVTKPNFLEIEKALKEMDTSSDLPLDPSLFDFGDKKQVHAGWWDDLKKKWVSERFRAEFIRKRKLALKHIINSANVVVEKVRLILDQMHRNRAQGDIEGYIKNLQNVSKQQLTFETNFKPVYREYLKPLVDEVLSQQKETEEHWQKEQESKIVPQEEVIPLQPESPLKKPEEVSPESDSVEVQFSEPKPLSEPPTTPMPIASPVPSASEPPKMRIEPKSEPEPITEPVVSEDIETEPQTMRSEKMKQSHQQFFKRMLKLAKLDDPYLLSLGLLKYAEEIEDQDLETSLKLTALAEGILDD